MPRIRWEILKARAGLWRQDLSQDELPVVASLFPPRGRAPEFSPRYRSFLDNPGLRACADAAKTARLRLSKGKRAGLVSRYGETGLVFIHVPKNAGSAVTHVLYGKETRHSSARFLMTALSPPFYDRCVSFAIVREPRARFVSAFSYLKSSSVIEADHAFRDRYLNDVPDVAAMAARLHDPRFRRAVTRWPHFREQCQYVCDKDGRLLVDYLFGMRRMGEVATFLGALTGSEARIPAMNASPKKETGDVDWSAVDRLYERDAALFAAVSASPKDIIRSGRAAERAL